MATCVAVQRDAAGRMRTKRRDCSAIEQGQLTRVLPRSQPFVLMCPCTVTYEDQSPLTVRLINHEWCVTTGDLVV